MSLFSIELSSIGGPSVWIVYGLVVTGIGKVAIKFFSPESLKVKLFIFIILLIGCATGGVFLAEEIKNGELASTPEPLISSNPLSGGTHLFHLVSDVFAKNSEKWLFCGTYNGGWRSSNLEFGKDDPSGIKGKKFTLSAGLDVYDAPPQFSSFLLKWVFGKIDSSLSPGDQVEVISFTKLGKGRIWCQIKESIE